MMSEPIPDDAKRRRTWLIAGVLSLAVVLVGVGISFAVLAMRRPNTAPASFSPAQETSASASAAIVSTSSATATATNSAVTTAPTSTGGATSGTSSTTPPGQIVRAARVAYRLNGQVWVAGEDGSDARAVIASTIGDFSLSPDGKTLVIMQNVNVSASTPEHALLVDLGTGVQSSLPTATELPVWSPDSSWLAYTAGNESVHSIRRVNRDGTGDALVLSGAAEPQIAPDGHRIAYSDKLQVSANDTDPVRILDLTTRKSTDVPRSAGASFYAFASSGVLFFAKGGGGAWLGEADKALSKVTTVAPISGGATNSPGPLYPSPDGSKVLFAMNGDDGSSRLQIADVAAKKIAAVDSVLDAAPLGWLLNGSGILDVEGTLVGNVDTSLYRRNPDGSHRKLVIDGASI